MTRVLILGGGTGGTMVANHLARRLAPEIGRGRLRLTLLAEEPWHTYQPGFLPVALGHAPLAHFRRPLPSLLLPGVELVTDPAELIDVQARRVRTRSGAARPFDFLVIATGAHPNPQEVPGMAEAAHSFYTGQEAVRLQQALARLHRGRIVITVGVPHKCPVAPLEMAFLLDHLLRQRGLRDQVELVYTYPINRVHVLAPVAEWAEEELRRRGIQYETMFNVERVEPATRTVYSLEGSEYPFDLLIAIPPHRGARVVQDSGLGDEAGFVPTDRFTLQALGHEGIYVVGDASNLPVSKAGSTAHYQADVVAAALAAQVRGEGTAAAYDGKVFCFIEAGDGMASYIEFAYHRPPRPAPPSPLIRLFKAAYNELYWLSARGVL